MTQAASTENRNKREYGLIVQQPGKPQQVLAKYVMLVLNYRYGLDIIVTDNFVEAFSIVQQHKNKIRCTFIIQNKNVEGTKSILSLNLDDAIPLLLLAAHPPARRPEGDLSAPAERGLLRLGDGLHPEENLPAPVH